MEANCLGWEVWFVGVAVGFGYRWLPGVRGYGDLSAFFQGAEGAEEITADLGVVAEHQLPEVVFDHGDDEGLVFGFGRSGAIAFALALPLVDGHFAEVLLHLAAAECAPGC